MIGETISHYRIIEQLGEGAMGVVYLAEDTTLGRQVAVKFLSSAAPQYRARFLREARSVSVLTHQNIATVFDYGETAEGRPYIVMELIKGQPLSERLREGSLPLPEAARIVSSIAAALGEAHHEGVVHRDIKPSNVIITPRGQVKVVDFGLVKHIYEQYSLDAESSRPTLQASRTRSDMIVGTPLYLSPEQATGKEIDGRSDLFALGAVLYECITGQSAFAGSSVIEIGAQVIHVTPPVPSHLNDQIPPELDRITMKALEKRVEARYQTADELISDLQALLPTLQIDGLRMPGRSTKSLKPQRTHTASALTTISESFRRPRLSLGTLIIAILAVALLSLGLWRWWRPRPYQPAAAALDWYNKGTDALRNGAFLQASKALEQAVANDNNFALAHARLAEAWFELDYADKAKDEMLRVTSLVPNRSQLATTDALYLEAINANVTRDFPVAIKAYTELAALSPGDPQVYLDLGRAYEKNDEIKKAIECYGEATNRAPQYATAFLRVAILYGRQLDLASASSAFDKADTLYQALGNFEGQAEVAYQHGFLLVQMAKMAEARQYLQRALELARTTANEYQQVKTLLKLGDVELDENHLPESRRYISEAIQLAQAKGIDNLTKRGLVDLGNTFLVEANYPEAEKYYRQSLELAQKQKDPRNAARASLVLGSLAERRSNPDEVVFYVEQAIPFYQQGGYRKETMQAFHLLARAKVQKGDYDAAQKGFEQALKLSQQLADSSTAGLAHHDIGRLFVRQGKYPEALGHFQESYEIAKSLGSQKNIGLTLTDRANALWRLGRYDEARAALTEASTLAERADAAKNLSYGYYLALARLALSERRFAEAHAKAQQALTRASTQIKIAAIEAASTSGLAQALSGASREGRVKCQEAVEIARELGDPFLLAEGLLALAEAQVESGDSPEALKSSLEARELFARFGKQDSEWLACLIAGWASRGGGDNTKAREYASSAEQLLSGLEQKWGKDNYDTYLNRADVQFSRKHLSELLAGKT
ncbi:MAG: tetratricopeptide repeat protein [Acidobacteriota bacterium]|nr:tetratricopeptide repeat protein [Acidobacteriota bacterium]